MRIAMKEAGTAITEGNSPFGAVLVDMEGNVIGKAHNTTVTDNDPTAHAEMNVIRQVAKRLKKKRLSGLCLVSNAQSCPMCFSAAIRSGITYFLYGCAEDETLVPKIDVFQLKNFCKGEVRIESGVIGGECLEQVNLARENTQFFNK